jgi:hypothetical protein
MNFNRENAGKILVYLYHAMGTRECKELPHILSSSSMPLYSKQIRISEGYYYFI